MEEIVAQVKIRFRLKLSVLTQSVFCKPVLNFNFPKS